MSALTIYDIPIEAKFNLLTYLSGIEIAKFREISKVMKALVDQVESRVYDLRVSIEFPKSHMSYFRVCNYREDWKNVYIICDQYKVAKSRTETHGEIIKGRDYFLLFERISFIAEAVLGLVTGLINIVKVAELGWSASRLLITEFLKANPGKTVPDALKALGLIKNIPLPEINYL